MKNHRPIGDFSSSLLPRINPNCDRTRVTNVLNGLVFLSQANKSEQRIKIMEKQCPIPLKF